MIYRILQAEALAEESQGFGVETIREHRRPEFISGPYKLVFYTYRTKHFPLLKRVQHDRMLTPHPNPVLL